MITAKNYVAQAERNILQNIRAFKPNDRSSLVYLLNLLKTSVHFVMPDGGVIFDDGLKGIRDSIIKLPFPSITIEYFIQFQKEEVGNIKVHKRVIVANQLDDQNIVVHGLFFVNNYWTPAPVSLCIDTNIKEQSNIEQGMMVKPFILLPDIIKDTGSENRINEFSADMIYEMKVVLELIEALSCTNIETTIHQLASPKNAQRIKSHKLPIYETKVLTIKVGKQQQAAGNKTGSYQSPRQHLRRGHIRRLESGNIWVSSCVVGSKDNGVINKSYKVQ